ncbi:hypothetical protein D3C76_1452370 [compost metagenome]
MLAENQKCAASLLNRAQAVMLLNLGDTLISELNHVFNVICQEAQKAKRMIEHAKDITDGTGCLVVAHTLHTLSSQKMDVSCKQ